MKTNVNINSLRKTKSENFLVGALLIIVFVLVALLVLRLFQNNSQTPEIINTPVISREYLDVINNKAAFFNTYKLILSDGWQVSAYYKNPSDSKIDCIYQKSDSKTECLVYEVTDQSSTYYISAKYPLQDTTILGSIRVTEKIKLFNEEKDLNIDKSDVVTRSDVAEGGESKSIEEAFIKSAYVCYGSGFCVAYISSDFNLDNNKDQFSKFKIFLSELKLEDI